MNGELFDYATHITLFAQNQLPDAKTVDNSEYYEEVRKAFFELKKLPMYSAIEIGLRRPYYLKKTILQPETIQSI